MQYQVSIWRKNDQVRLVKVSHWGTYQIRYLYTHVECGFDYLLRICRESWKQVILTLYGGGEGRERVCDFKTREETKQSLDNFVKNANKAKFQHVYTGIIEY